MLWRPRYRYPWRSELTRYVPRQRPRIEVCPPRSRIVQEALRMVLERIHEPSFSDGSYGQRPGTGHQVAMKQIGGTWNGIEWYLQFRIDECYANMHRGRLINSLKVRDEAVLDLVRMFCFDYSKIVGIRKNLLSPLLCNIMLDPLDREVQRIMQEYCTPRVQRPLMHKSEVTKVKYIRYLDQLVIGVQGPELLVRGIQDRVLKFLSINRRYDKVHSKYQTIADEEEPELLGLRIKVLNHDEVRNFERGMEKRHRHKRRIKIRVQKLEAAFENKVGHLLSKLWRANTRYALDTAAKAAEEIVSLNKEEHLSGLARYLDDFFTTQPPAGQDLYMTRKHLEC